MPRHIWLLLPCFGKYSFTSTVSFNSQSRNYAITIYFFTLIGAYKYGWKAGLLITVLSPVINSLFFGMPSLQVLPAILIKSILLAFSASVAAKYFKRISIAILLIVVISYQVAGTLAEWFLTGSFLLPFRTSELPFRECCYKFSGDFP